MFYPFHVTKILYLSAINNKRKKKRKKRKELWLMKTNKNYDILLKYQ